MAISKFHRWLFYFFTGNILLFWLIGLNYLSVIPWLDTSYILPRGKILLSIFATLCYLGQLGFLAFIPMIIFFFLSIIIPKSKILVPLAILTIVVLATSLIADTYIYKLYRFHLNGVIFNLILQGTGEQVFGISSKESLTISFIILLLTSLEIIYAWILWKSIKFHFSYLKWILITSIVSYYLSYCMLAFSSGFLVNRIMVDIARSMPMFPLKNQSQSYTVQAKKFSAPLQYPLHPLTFSSQNHLYNLVIIVIDTWRYDMLNPKVTPTLSQFAKQSLLFTNHISGGNATGPGIFSLFYGLPASYWSTMEIEKQGPVLIQELIKRNYHISVFSSAELYSPPINKTVFAELKYLNPHQQPAATAYLRDKMVTQKFKEFLGQHLQQPFFSFLFYDAAHSYCEYDDDLKPLHPAVPHCNRMELNNQLDPLPYFNRYKNALLLVDRQIKDVISSLEKNNLLKNTIIVITGDHGEEFNDNHLGYWGHASNFTRYQTATPFILYWPGMQPQVFKHQTSHFDLVPTLMQNLLNCQSPINDYALGKNLFKPSPNNYYIIGSYISLGILEPNQITEISQTGNFETKLLNGQLSTQAVNQKTLTAVFQDMQRFLKWQKNLLF